MKNIATLLFILLLPAYGQSNESVDGWYNNAIEMIEDGNISAAKITIDSAASRKALMSDPVERVTYDMQIADGYAKLGKINQSSKYFNKAFTAALKITDSNDKIKASIQVLEIRSEVMDIENIQLLLQQSIDQRMLFNIAASRNYSSINSYIKYFANATRTQIYELINQLKNIDNDKVRKKVLLSILDLNFAAPVNSDGYLQLSTPLGMDDFEKFLWFSVSAKYFADTGKAFILSQKVSSMEKAYDVMGVNLQKKYRKIYRSTKNLNYKKKKQSIAPKNINDVFYGGAE